MPRPLVVREELGGHRLVRIDALCGRPLRGRPPGARGRPRGEEGYTSSGKSVQCVCPSAGRLHARSGGRAAPRGRGRGRASGRVPRAVAPRASACGTVRGKPSSRKPRSQSGAPGPLVDEPDDHVVRDEAPAAIFATRSAGRLPSVFAARSMSPGRDLRQSPTCAQTTFACVPFPAPGGPTNTSRMPAPQSFRTRMREVRAPPPERPS